uniref:Protein yippee-like n=1 Tax=Echeneis naucrates TaxID=173247 RepID=A0A665VWR7_ECHNA
MEYDDSVLIQRVDGLKPEIAATGGQLATLHCAQCCTVLGDSLSVCGEMRSLDSIICLKVTSDVLISDEKESGHKGEMANCIYSTLKCVGCCRIVGRVIDAAPSRLATIRSLFLLYKPNISCYVLNSRSMVKASEFSFAMKPIREYINEVREQSLILIQ